MINSKNTKKLKKKSSVRCKVCNNETEIIYENEDAHYPVFSCPQHGIQQDEWKRWWEQYSEKWKDKQARENPRDKLVCLIGYFCYKYKQFYGHPYTFDSSNPIPYKSKDFIIGRRILSMFDNDITDSLLYIKWVFLKKVASRKRTVSSLGFFSLTNLVNEYKCAKALNNVIKRQTNLPEDFINWCKQNYNNVFEKHSLSTWNDLNVLISFVNTFGNDNEEGHIINEAINRNLINSVNGSPQFKSLED